MTKIEYMKYRANEEAMPVAFHHWNENKKPEHTELSYPEFVHLFSRYASRFRGDFFGDLFKYYDNKFTLVFVKDQEGKTFQIIE